MSRNTAPRSITVRLFAIVALTSLVGCATTIGGYGILNPAPIEMPDPAANPDQWKTYSERAAEQPAEADAAERTVVLSVKPQWGRTRHYTLPLSEDMTVQTALEAQRLPRKFRNMEINVVRVTPHSNGQRVPLKAEYDTVKNRVGILHDMILLPGDHVMVEEINRTRLDELLGGMTGGRR